MERGFGIPGTEKDDCGDVEEALGSRLLFVTHYFKVIRVTLASH
jgi:hypothetical protein